MITVANEPALQPVADEAASRLRAALETTDRRPLARRTAGIRRHRLARLRPNCADQGVHRVARASRDGAPEPLGPHHGEVAQRVCHRFRGLEHGRVLRSAGALGQVRDIVPDPAAERLRARAPPLPGAGPRPARVPEAEGRRSAPAGTRRARAGSHGRQRAPSRRPRRPARPAVGLCPARRQRSPRRSPASRGWQATRVAPLAGGDVQRACRREVLQLGDDEPVRLGRPDQIASRVPLVPLLALHPAPFEHCSG